MHDLFNELQKLAEHRTNISPLASSTAMIDRMHRNFKLRFAASAAALCFAIAIGAPAQDTSAQDWKTYSYPADGFSASFPSMPEMQKRDVPTAAGSFELRSYIVAPSDSAIFVGVCDYGAATAGKDPDTELQGAKNGALTNSKSHLVSENKITLGIYQGLEFESESDSAHFSARIYMVGTTLYQALVVSPLGKPYVGAARFLNSFQLIPRSATEPPSSVPSA
jgi:hypothetical protein